MTLIKNWTLPPMPHALTKTLRRPKDLIARLPLAFAADLDGFVSGLRDDIDATLFSREVPAAVQQELNALPARALPAGRYVLKPQDVSAALRTLFEARGLQDVSALIWLRQDAAGLARAISQHFEADLVRLRLEAIDDNACAKLHIDNVTARMICAYRGPGTQIGFADTPQEALYTTPTGQPLLLKGLRWSSTAAPELSHKSPPMEGTGETRLVLVLEGIEANEIYPEYDTLFGEAKTEWDK